MPTPEGLVLKSILEYLAVRHVWAMRINTGAIAGEYKGKRRFFKFGQKGCADVFCTPLNKWGYPVPTWLEIKAEKGRQSESQKEFEQEVRQAGHRYAVCRSIEDVALVMKSIE